jgi:hypothetical protein
MVHALQLSHRILRPNGLLVNIHDLPTPHVIEIRSPETTHKVGWVDRDDFANTLASLSGLAQVVADGQFLLEDQRDFDYNVSVDSLSEFQRWMADRWESAILGDKTTKRIQGLVRDADPSTRIVLVMRARMTKLRAI